MEEQRLTYFDIIEVIDRVFPPKSIFDYTQITVDELIARFDKIIEESGYSFNPDSITGAHNVIKQFQRFNVGRTSVFVGGRNAKFFDQNNYTIQNSLSQMKNSITRVLSKQLNYKFYGQTFNTGPLGGIERLRKVITKENVRNYVTSVLTSTWEERDTLKNEEYALANDILLHFGIKTDSTYSGTDYSANLSTIIGKMEFESRDFFGKRSSEGFYDRSETNRDKHPKVLKDTIDKVTDLVYNFLKETLDRTVEMEARFAAQKASERKEEPIVAKVAELKNPQEEKKEFATPTAVETPIEEVSVAELESTRDKYEEVQALAAENIKLAQELEALRKQAAEIAARIKANNEEITKRLTLD